jgi:hypothetical protein
MLTRCFDEKYSTHRRAGAIYVAACFESSSRCAFSGITELSGANSVTFEKNTASKISTLPFFCPRNNEFVS